MKKLTSIVITALVFSSISVFADTVTKSENGNSTHLNNAIALVSALGIEKRYQKNQEMIQSRLDARLGKLRVAEDSPLYDRVEIFKSDVKEMMVDVFDWPSDQNAIANAYAQHFSREELEQLLTFFQSPAYQSFLVSKGVFQTQFEKISQKRNEKVSKEFAQIYASLRSDLLASQN